MGGKGSQIGGLALCMLGVLGVCLACGLPMWREASYVGANIVTAQWVWDGLWLQCIVQATGQMQCKRHSPFTLTPDIQAGRALTLLSILCGLLGFIVTLLGGGVVNCSGTTPDNYDAPPTYATSTTNSATSSTRKKACLLGGALCLLSGALCLISVSWSAAVTMRVTLQRREVGTSVYIGWGCSALLLLAGILMCLVREERNPPAYTLYSSPFSDTSSGAARSDVVRPSGSRTVKHVAEVHDYDMAQRAFEPRDRSWGMDPVSDPRYQMSGAAYPWEVGQVG